MSKFFGIDKNIKTHFLRWGYMFDLGLSLDLAKERHDSKLYKKIRTYFSNQKTESIEELFNTLISLDFHPHKAEELTKILSVKSLGEYDLLINDLIDIIQARNTSVEYYTFRGWDIESAKKKIKNFFRAGNRSIQKKRENNPNYNDWYKNTRIKGAEKAHTINSDENPSKMEKKIGDLLKKKHSVESYYSPCVHPELNQLYHKKNYIHDFYVDQKYIIEYNGIFWHKDHFSFPNKFTLDDYMLEIKKAYNCIDLVSRNKKYIIIWENDFQDEHEIMAFLENIFSDESNNQNFYSSRVKDIELYTEYKYSQEKQYKQNKLFGDIVTRISEESHCESKKVAAIAVKNGRIIATGINGSVSGLVNCNDYFREEHKLQKIKINYEDWKKTTEWRKQHIEWSDHHEIHAEQALIAESVKNGIALSDVDIYVSLEPCMNCSKILAAVGPNRIFYVNEYDRKNPKAKSFLNNAGIILQKI